MDFVVFEDTKVLAVDGSYGRGMASSAPAALPALRSAAGRRETDLLIITKDTEKIENGVRFMPLWKWLLEKG